MHIILNSFGNDSLARHIDSFLVDFLIQITCTTLHSVIAKKIAELYLRMCYKFGGQVTTGASNGVSVDQDNETLQI